jgi:hypothetical protein
MSSDVSTAIRQRLLRDACIAVPLADRIDEYATHVVGVATRYAEAIKHLLDLCDTADAMTAEQRREFGAPTTLAIRRVIAEQLGVDGG